MRALEGRGLRASPRVAFERTRMEALRAQVLAPVPPAPTRPGLDKWLGDLAVAYISGWDLEPILAEARPSGIPEAWDRLPTMPDREVRAWFRTQEAAIRPALEAERLAGLARAMGILGN